ncbi:Glutaminyl-tRNA synthetase [Hypoxylon texense]
MDMHLDLKVGYDEAFNFDSHLPYSSSTGSFSSASTASSMPEPFTPTSGRSTPGLRSVSMEHEHIHYPASGGFELTPPSSTFGGFYPPDVKADFQRYMQYHSASPSPSRKSSIQAQSMEMEYAPMMPNTYPPLSSQEHGLESAGSQQLNHFSFAEYVASPPFPVSTSGYPVDNAASWAWTGDSPVSLFGRGHQSASPSPSQPLPPRDRNNLTPSYLASHGRRRVNMNKVQQKSSALHRAQDRSGIRIERIAAATFNCNYPNCQKGPFKRQEHLKRHKITKHADNPSTIITSCPICEKPFNRKDNYRQHLKLHTLMHRPTRRTDYHPDAQAILDEEINKTKQRSQLKKKSAPVKNEEL